MGCLSLGNHPSVTEDDANDVRRDAKGTGTRKRPNQLSQAKPRSAKKQKGVQCGLNFRLHCSSLCLSYNVGVFLFVNIQNYLHIMLLNDACRL